MATKKHNIEIYQKTGDGYRIKVENVIVDISNTAMACFGIRTIDNFNVGKFINYVQENARGGFLIKRDTDFSIEHISLLDNGRIKGSITIDGEKETRTFAAEDDLYKKFINNK
jgi:hypothetical protein